jgi:hypothetical protein
MNMDAGKSVKSGIEGADNGVDDRFKAFAPGSQKIFKMNSTEFIPVIIDIGNTSGKGNMKTGFSKPGI